MEVSSRVKQHRGKHIAFSIFCRFFHSSLYPMGNTAAATGGHTHTAHAQTHSLMGRVKVYPCPLTFFLYLINPSRNSAEEKKICIRFFAISAQKNKLCEIHCTLHAVLVLSTLYVIDHHNNVENVAVHYCRFAVFQNVLGGGASLYD